MTRIDILKNIQAEPPQGAADYKTDLGRDSDIFSDLLPADKSHKLLPYKHPDFLGPPVHINDDPYQGPPIYRLPHRKPSDLGPPPRDLNEDQPRPIREPRRYPPENVDTTPERSNLPPPQHPDGLMTPGSAEETKIPAAPDGVTTTIDQAGKDSEAQGVAETAPAPGIGSPTIDLGQLAATAATQADPSAANALVINFVIIPTEVSLAAPDPAIIAAAAGLTPKPAELAPQAITASTAGSIAVSAAILNFAPAQTSAVPGTAPLLTDALQPAAPTSDDAVAANTAPQSEETSADPAAALIAKLLPEKKAIAIPATDTTVTSDDAQTQLAAQGGTDKPAATLQQVVDTPTPNDKINLAVDKADKPGVKADVVAPSNSAKADAPVAMQPHPPAVQTAHAQQINTTVHLPPVADTQAALARVGVALARVPFEIAVSAHKGEKEFEIRLDPPELGRVDVSMSVDKNGRIATHLIVERPATLDQLRRDAPNLERALQNSGLKTDSGSLQFSLRDQSAQNFADHQDRNGAIRRGILHVALETTAIAQPYMASLGSGRGLGLDLRV